jgi:hypothetical protein
MAEIQRGPEMTDPRLIECAKAMHYADWSPCVWSVDELWAQAGEAKREIYLIRARACILKWLEQKPTGAMSAAAEVRCHKVNMGDGGSSVCAMYLGDGGLSSWDRVCAQAAKEIGGGE